MKRIAFILAALVALAIPAGAQDVRSINVTPIDCSGAITTGGTAQNAHAAFNTLQGVILQNINTSETLWFSITGTAAADTAGSYALGPGAVTTFLGAERFMTSAGFGYNTALSVVAATTGHKFTCTRFMSTR